MARPQLRARTSYKHGHLPSGQVCGCWARVPRVRRAWNGTGSWQVRTASCGRLFGAGTGLRFRAIGRRQSRAQGRTRTTQASISSGQGSQSRRQATTDNGCGFAQRQSADPWCLRCCCTTFEGGYGHGQRWPRSLVSCVCSPVSRQSRQQPDAASVCGIAWSRANLGPAHVWRQHSP